MLNSDVILPKKHNVRYYEIDLLRFIAAISVVFYHYTFWASNSGNSYINIKFNSISGITKYGYLGVELFFIISGYVVLLSAQGKTVRQFLVSRIIRLYPAFWVAYTITFLTERIWYIFSPLDIIPGYLLPTNWQYIVNMTMLHEFFGIPAIDGAYWSLTVEITFYFLISLIIAYKLINHLNTFIILWLLYVIISAFATKVMGADTLRSPFFALLFPRYAPYFISGMLFYLLRDPLNRSQVKYFLLGLSYILAIRSSLNHSGELSVLYKVDFSGIITSGIISGYFALFFLIIFNKTVSFKIKWFTWLGALTYPLYLLHENIGFILFKIFENVMNKYFVLSIILLIMILSAYLIHIFIEKRFNKSLGMLSNKIIDKILN